MIPRLLINIEPIVNCATCIYSDIDLLSIYNNLRTYLDKKNSGQIVTDRPSIQTSEFYGFDRINQ